ncbi:MAG: chemotaxis protein CheX [Armatimonadota bacterium]
MTERADEALPAGKGCPVKAEFVQPFVAAAFSVIEMVANEPCERGPLAIRNGATFTSQEVSVVIGVSGQVCGVAVYGLARATALKIASAMSGQRVVELDDESLSAIAELGNMITGGATTSLSDNGYECTISPPSIVRGTGVQVTTVTPALLIPVRTRLGRIDINIALTLTEDSG